MGPYDCTHFTCPADLPVNKGANIKCPGDLTSCDAQLCCQKYATCDTFTCPANSVNKPTKLCKDGTALSITDCDADTCCDEKATCATFEGCKGKSSEYADKILEKITPPPACIGDASTCNTETCCEAVTAEDACFSRRGGGVSPKPISSAGG